MKYFNRLFLSFIAVIGFACASQEGFQQPLDREATKETTILYNNMKQVAEHGIMFGHHEAMAYGVGWWKEEGRSDVKEICGSYPVVHGWDLGKIGTANSINKVPFEDVLNYIKDVYKRGGINTVAWHMDNPVSGGNSWDTTNAVKEILPGGKVHEFYLKKLDLVAEFFENCRTENGTPIPIIFRPFHEHNGDWFWWGKNISTEEEFIQLWRFTVDYLKNEKEIHHLLYAFSPDRSRMKLAEGAKAYLYAYPGDEYVDIIGVDDYWDMGFEGNPKSLEEQKVDLLKSLQLIDSIARVKGKIAALTETGLDKLVVADWYTGHLLETIKKSPKPIQLAYIMVWRNANEGHHYVPYAGHPAEADFRQFCEDPRVLLEDDLQHLYEKDEPLLVKER